MYDEYDPRPRCECGAALVRVTCGRCEGDGWEWSGPGHYEFECIACLGEGTYLMCERPAEHYKLLQDLGLMPPAAPPEGV